MLKMMHVWLLVVQSFQIQCSIRNPNQTQHALIFQLQPTLHTEAENWGIIHSTSTVIESKIEVLTVSHNPTGKEIFSLPTFRIMNLSLTVQGPLQTETVYQTVKSSIFLVCFIKNRPLSIQYSVTKNTTKKFSNLHQKSVTILSK